MKDVKDLRTADLSLPPKLGRPVSGNALSNSQKQKAYRQRKREQGSVTVILTLDELARLVGHLNLAPAGYPDYQAMNDALLARLAPLLDPALHKFRDGLDAQGKKS